MKSSNNARNEFWRIPIRIRTVVFVSMLICRGSCLTSNAQEPRFVDHSLLIAPELPCTWPSHPFPRFAIIHSRTIGPESTYNIDTLLIDGNTGTQLDVPPHSVARPELNRDKSGPLGLAYTDKIEPWQFGGEACVVDVRELLDKAPKGESPLVKVEHVERFEKQHRKVRFGDVVLFRSDYSDHYYQPLPEGRRYIADILDRKASGYPDPDPDCMEFLGKRGVLTLGTDSASMGPLPDLAEPTHYAGLKYGMIWTEGATNLRELPSTGAFYCLLAPKHELGPYSEGRAFSVAGGELPKRLIDACRHKRAIDLSPTLSPKLPLTSSGLDTGNHRQVYLKIDFLYSEYLDMWLQPLQGKAEGWPAPGPDAILYLKSKGVRCVASDAPDLGGVDPKRALMTYWALASREMVGVEFLVNIDKIPAQGAYFMFAAVKVRNCNGGPGRAIVLY